MAGNTEGCPLSPQEGPGPEVIRFDLSTAAALLVALAALYASSILVWLQVPEAGSPPRQPRVTGDS